MTLRFRRGIRSRITGEWKRKWAKRRWTRSRGYIWFREWSTVAEDLGQARLGNLAWKRQRGPSTDFSIPCRIGWKRDHRTKAWLRRSIRLARTVRDKPK